LWPLLLGALPLAFFGGAIQLPGQYYRPLVGMPTPNPTIQMY
jgi:hypothetical protein